MKTYESKQLPTNLKHMRTQEELNEYYQRIDNSYRGEVLPEGWRFVDLISENINIKNNLMSFFGGGWFVPEGETSPLNTPDWVWITNLPLTESAPESAPENAAQNSTKTNMKTYNVKFGHVIYKDIPADKLAATFINSGFNKGVNYNLSEIMTCLSSSKVIPSTANSFDLEIVPLYGYFTILTKDGKVPSFQTYSEVASFVYRKNRDEVTKRRIGVTEEDSQYIKGIDLDDSNSFKQFLKEKIVGGWIVRENA
jgi:hypothetical protein